MNNRQLPLSEEASAILREALERTIDRRQLLCEPEQLLEILLLHRQSSRAAGDVSHLLDGREKLPFDPPRAELSRVIAERVMPQASRYSAACGSSEIDPNAFLAILLNDGSPISVTLRSKIRNLLDLSEKVQSQEFPTLDSGSFSIKSRQADSQSSFLTPFVCSNAEYLVDRLDLVDRVAMTLRYSSPLLVGPHGSGRSSIIRLLAKRFHGITLPAKGRDMKLWCLDLIRLIAGTTYRGELEERLSKLAAQLAKHVELPVLVIENFQLLGSNSTGSNKEVLLGLVPLLKGGRIRLIGCITNDHFREHVETNPELLNCLTPINVEASDRDTAVSLLTPASQQLEEQYGVAVNKDLVATAVDLCRQHLPHLALPGVANLLLRDAVSRLSFEFDMLTQQPERAHTPYWVLTKMPRPDTIDLISLNKRQLLLALSERHRIPFHHLNSGANDKIRDFACAFRARLFGQDQVLTPLQKTITVALSNLADPRRPLGRILLVGPPGTGKTECALLLAQHLMGEEDALLRFDMSEFSDRSGVSTLIGSDKGLVGSSEGGRLTEPLRINPHRVILFDEIEKAHSSIYDLFLQLLDNGRLTDKLGNQVSFRHAFIIFTSNAGCAGEPNLPQLSRAQLLARLGSVFRPEFLDRMEQVIPFRALDEAARRRVAVAQLEQIRQHLAAEYGLDLQWTPAVCNAAGPGDSDEAGARCILRWIHETVKPAIAQVLLMAPPQFHADTYIQLRVAHHSGVSARMVTPAPLQRTKPATKQPVQEVTL